MCANQEMLMKKNPPITVVRITAIGIERVGRFASSAIVEIASKPRNDRQRTAEPATTAGRLKSDRRNGSSGPVSGSNAREAKAKKTRKKTIWSTTSTTLALLTTVIPMMLRAVTSTSASMLKTH